MQLAFSIVLIWHHVHVLLVCLVCAARGRRLQSSTLHPHHQQLLGVAHFVDEVDTRLSTQSDWRVSPRGACDTLGALLLHLLSCDPAAAFSHSGSAAHPELGDLIVQRRHTEACRRNAPIQLADDVGVGSIIEFSKNDKNIVGAITEPDGKKNWKVLTSGGITTSITPKQIRYVAQKNTGGDLKECLESYEHVASDPIESERVEELYETTADEGDFALSELAELLFSEASPLTCFAMYRCLTMSPAGSMYFRATDKTGTVFAARPSDVVDSLRKKANAEARVEQAREDFKAHVFASSRASPFNLTAQSEEVQEKFAAVALFGSRTSLSKEVQVEIKEPTDDMARSLLQELDIKRTPEAAKAFMQGIGLWSVHECLDLIRLKVRTEFTEEQIADAEAIVEAPPADLDAGSRRDLSHLLAFAIDEASTVEVDDALSIEQLSEADGGGHLVWIHIADPTRYVTAGSELQKEAMLRGSTIYMPTGTIPMLPMSLAAGPCSLGTGGEKPSCALSIGVRLDQFGEIDQTFTPILTPSLVRVQRLTLVDVDAILRDSVTSPDGDSDASEVTAPPELGDDAIQVLLKLQSAANARLSRRIFEGSIESMAEDRLPDVKIKATRNESEPDGWSVDVRMLSPGPARKIVTEMMLLAGEVVACYAAQHGIPMPFRTQQYKVDKIGQLELQLTPEGPARSYIAIRQVTRSQVGAVAVKHEGLGLASYLQVTSPIRRYPDLAVHYQLKAHLRGEELPFPPAGPQADVNGNGELLKLARECGENARIIERSETQYWLRQWLGRQAGKPMRAMVLGTFRDLYTVMLTDVGALVDIKSVNTLSIGEELEIRPNANGDFNV